MTALCLDQFGPSVAPIPILLSVAEFHLTVWAGGPLETVEETAKCGSCCILISVCTHSPPPVIHRKHPVLLGGGRSAGQGCQREVPWFLGMCALGLLSLPLSFHQVATLHRMQ